MSQITKQINKLLSDDALSHSLSKEALERMLAEIKKLDNDCCELSKENKNLRADLKNCTKNLSESRAESYGNRRENEKWKEREEELLDREKVCSRTEIENEYAVKRGDEHYRLITSIFANRTFRESVVSKYPVVDKTTYDSNGMIQENEMHIDVTKTKTTETEEK